MTDVCLVKLEPGHDIRGLPPPFGILYLADALEKAGFQVKLFHTTCNRAALRGLVAAVRREKPLWVGFSNFTTSPLGLAGKISFEIGKGLNVPIVWGGVHSTIFPRQTLQNDFVDMVSLGEGEETAVELTGTLARSGPDPRELAKIRGIGFKRAGEIIINEDRPFIGDLDKYSPAWHQLGIENYIYNGGHFYNEIGSKLGGGKTAALITSRGCPWRCGYCYNQAVHRRRFRAQSVDKVMKEVEYLKSFGVSALIFEDDNFFSDRERATEIIRRIGIPWSCSIRADYIAKWGENFLAQLKANNCYELRIGVESGSQRVLDLMQKDITLEQIRGAIALCARFEIRTLLNFMVGIPGETWDDVCRSLDLVDELEKCGRHVTVSSVGIYAPWPGTVLSVAALAQGFHPPKKLAGWSRFWAQRSKIPPYADRRIKFIGFYRVLIRKDFAGLPFPFLAGLLRRVALFRWRRRYFRWPLDYYVPAFFLRMLRRCGLRRLAGALYE
jgi:radical SAM superfamily enzyme YgiQ (UPF0313 family)